MGYFKNESVKTKFILLKDHAGYFKEGEHGSGNTMWKATE